MNGMMNINQWCSFLPLIATVFAEDYHTRSPVLRQTVKNELNEMVFSPPQLNTSCECFECVYFIVLN